MTTMNNEDPADPSVHEPRQAPMPCPFCGHVGLAGAEYDDLLYDAERYRFLRRKFAIVGGGDGAEFRALNLPRPTYIAPDPAAELDAAIDASVCRQCGHDNDAHDRQYGCAEDGCDCLTPNVI